MTNRRTPGRPDAMPGEQGEHRGHAGTGTGQREDAVRTGAQSSGEDRVKRSTARGANGKFTSSEDAARVRGEAVRLRSSGLSYARIAQRLGISKSAAWETVQAAYAQVALDAAPVALALELERLDEDLTTLTTIKDRLLHALNTGAGEDGKGPDVVAVSNSLVRLTETRGRIGERHARLRGLDAPTTVRVEQAGGISAADVLARVAAVVRPYPDAAAAVSALLLELAEQARETEQQ